MKKIPAYEIALSALACALATTLMTVGVYSSIFLFTGYLFAGVALMLPLAKKSYVGYFLAYVATCICSLIFCSAFFFDVLPFIMFFGLHPLVNELQLKTKMNTWVACLIKAAWFDGTMYVIWRFVFDMTTTVAFVDQFILPIILIGGTLFFVGYDYVMFKSRVLVNRLVERITRH